MSNRNGRVGKERDTVMPQKAIIAGNEKYTDIRIPTLAIFSVPHGRNAATADTNTEAQVNAFEHGVSSATCSSNAPCPPLRLLV